MLSWIQFDFVHVLLVHEWKILVFTCCRGGTGARMPQNQLRAGQQIWRPTIRIVRCSEKLLEICYISSKGTWREIHRQCATAQGHEMPWTKSKLDEVWPVFRWFDYVPFRLVSGRPRRWSSSQKLGELNPPSSDPLGSGTAGAACKAKHSVKRRTSAMFRMMNGCRTEWFVYLNVCWILDIHGLIG